MIKAVLYLLLFVWIIFWAASFLDSVVKHNADPIALIFCLIGILLWGRFDGEGRR